MTAIVLLDGLTLLVILPQDGIGKGIQGKLALLISIHNLIIDRDDTRNTVDIGNKGSATEDRLADTWIQRLITILTIADRTATR